jgi:hypothetical protein
LGKDHLDNVAPINVFNAFVYRRGVLLRSKVRAHLYGNATSDFRAYEARRQFQRMRQASYHLIDLAGSLRIFLLYITVQANMADHLDVVPEMVEDQKGIAKHKN